MSFLLPADVRGGTKRKREYEEVNVNQRAARVDVNAETDTRIPVCL